MVHSNRTGAHDVVLIAYTIRTSFITTRMPSCIFWVYSAPDVLNARLDARVDAMIKVLQVMLHELGHQPHLVNEH